MRLLLIILILIVIFAKIVLESETFQIKTSFKEDELYKVSHFEWHWDNFFNYLETRVDSIKEFFAKKF